jgi:hypothetical protein
MQWSAGDEQEGCARQGGQGGVGGRTAQGDDCHVARGVGATLAHDHRRPAVQKGVGQWMAKTASGNRVAGFVGYDGDHGGEKDDD